MQRLVEDLFVAAQLGEGQFKLKPGPMDLAECIRQVVAEQQARASRHHLVVDGPSSLTGTWDEGRVRQMLTNIISNAVKYSPEGGEVRVAFSRANGLARVEVSDQGPGISEEDLSRLFQPFARLDRAKPVAGTGLGLFISKGIVESHGGRIWVDSEIGRGSTFVITLPDRLGDVMESQGVEQAIRGDALGSDKLVAS
jgi:signal transduction histidine kinase